MRPALPTLPLYNEETDSAFVASLYTDERASDEEVTVMAVVDPTQIIAAYVTEPRVLTSETPIGGGWQQQTWRGGVGANASTICFLKDRSIPRRRVYAVLFETEGGQRMCWTGHVTQDDTGVWHMTGGAGGGDERGPARDQPWANLGGGDGDSDFYAGGTVLSMIGRDVARVRLRAANGTIMEDTVDDGVVLFITDQPVELPLHAELYDQAGTLVGQHPVFA